MDYISLLACSSDNKINIKHPRLHNISALPLEIGSDTFTPEMCAFPLAL